MTLDPLWESLLLTLDADAPDGIINGFAYDLHEQTQPLLDWVAVELLSFAGDTEDMRAPCTLAASVLMVAKFVALGQTLGPGITPEEILATALEFNRRRGMP